LHTRHTENIWLKVSNENLPCEHLCGGNKIISSELNILRFGTVSNTTEYCTTVFESDDQVGIWKLESLTRIKRQSCPMVRGYNCTEVAQIKGESEVRQKGY
jgi:hypothetical protein